MYLNKRGGIYQFRKPVPNHLVGIIGRADLRVSLGTPLAPVARRRALDMLVRVDEIFELLRSAKPEGDSRRLAIQMLEEAAKSVCGTPWRAERQIKALNATITQIRALDALQKGSDADSFFQAGLDRLEAKIAHRVQEAVSQGHKARYSTEKLSVEIEAYKQIKIPRLDGKHRDDVPRRLDLFLAVVGDMEIRELTRTHLGKFRDLIDQAPQKWQQRFKTNDPATAIERNAKRRTRFPLLDPETVNLKYIGPVRRFLDDLVADGKIERNPAARLHSKRTLNEKQKTAPNQKRLPFKVNQLNAILGEASKRSKFSAAYWTPVAMLLSGARLNEICQLRTDDFVQHNGRPHLSVLCVYEHDEDDGDQSAVILNTTTGDDRRVKSPAGRRLIPVHPILIEIGFLDFIESRKGKGGLHGQLFRKIKPDKHNYFSGATSKALNRLIKKVVSTAGPLRSVYSFRHNFSDACDAAAMPERVKNKLMGHQLSGAPGVYGNPLPLPHESEWIDQVSYDGVDFQPYMRQSFGA